jgi:hypothetical protein
MALKPLSAAEIEKSQEELKKMLLPGSDVQQANVKVVEQLAKVGRFEYPEGSGIWYSVPTIPFREGLQIKDLYLRIKLAQDGVDRGMGYLVYQDQLKELLDIAWKLCIPERKMSRFIRWLFKRYNPFYRVASEGDIAVLISFFLVRRMMSNVRFHFPAVDQGSQDRSTSSTS